MKPRNFPDFMAVTFFTLRPFWSGTRCDAGRGSLRRGINHSALMGSRDFHCAGGRRRLLEGGPLASSFGRPQESSCTVHGKSTLASLLDRPMQSGPSKTAMPLGFFAGQGTVSTSVRNSMSTVEMPFHSRNGSTRRPVLGMSTLTPSRLTLIERAQGGIRRAKVNFLRVFAFNANLEPLSCGENRS